jgi:predicted amidohydrolase YtcJ
MGIGNSFSSIDLRNARAASDVIEPIRRYVRFVPRGRWILGSSWNDANLKLPDRSSLDAITPDNPVFLYHADGRSAFANSVALRLARLKADATGVERDAKGEPSGVVRGDALARIRASVPANHTRNWAEIAETATNYAASLGVTSVQDMHSDDSREIYRELHRQGKLKTRVYDCIPLPEWKKLAGIRESDDMVRGGCLKSFSDGEEGSGARLLRDVPTADKAGLQVMIHAIGNSANSIVLGVFEQVTKVNGPRDRRFRIEHAHNPRFADLTRFQTPGIIASMQPHLFNGGSGGYYGSLLKQRTWVAFGSDAAITDLNPILGIHAAVNAGDESISVYEAVRAYTVGSAYAEFQEKQKGTTEVGKLADFVILSDDIFGIDSEEIFKATVAMTIVNGALIFESTSFRSK